MLCGVIPGILAMTMLIRSSGTICHRIFGRPEALFLGRIFYGIYLWHLPILNFMDAYGVGWRYRLLFGPALSIAFATLSYAYVERHFLRRRPASSRPPTSQPLAPASDAAPVLPPIVRSREASSRA
jgi:peptidoglycan/LPS O-acetylase OafA/YrhL